MKSILVQLRQVWKHDVPHDFNLSHDDCLSSFHLHCSFLRSLPAGCWFLSKVIVMRNGRRGESRGLADHIEGAAARVSLSLALHISVMRTRLKKYNGPPPWKTSHDFMRSNSLFRKMGGGSQTLFENDNLIMNFEWNDLGYFSIGSTLTTTKLRSLDAILLDSKRDFYRCCCCCCRVRFLAGRHGSKKLWVDLSACIYSYNKEKQTKQLKNLARPRFARFPASSKYFCSPNRARLRLESAGSRATDAQAARRKSRTPRKFRKIYYI